MRRANGTGCVTKLSGNRRNPWFAKVTVGYNYKGRAIFKILSDDKGRKYFPSRIIPDRLLAKWNLEKGNVDINKSEYTFSQVFEEYKSKYFPTKEEKLLEKTQHVKTKGKLGRSVANNLQSAYNKCTILYDKLYKSLRKDDFMSIILKTEGCATVINSLANLFKKLDAYAESEDIIIKGYANTIKITEDLYKPVQNEGCPYTYEEIEKIWQYSGNLIADITLTTIYAGTRIEEILFTKTQDVYLEKGYFIAGLKTASGRRRIIPIHHELMPIFRKHYDKKNEFLFDINGRKIDYDKDFLPKYQQLMEDLGMKHSSHDGRRTLHSELDRLNANKVCVNKIFGHKTGDVGDDIYSKKGLEELRQTIELVNYRKNSDTKITYLKVI